MVAVASVVQVSANRGVTMSEMNAFVRPPARLLAVETAQAQIPEAPNFDELFKKMPGLDAIKDLAQKRLDALNAPPKTAEAALTPKEQDLAKGITQDVLDLSNRKWQSRLDLESRINGLSPAGLDRLLPTINKSLQPYDLRVAGVPDQNELVFGRLNRQTNRYEKPVFVDWQHRSQRA
jgi:hypothetical protein